MFAIRWKNLEDRTKKQAIKHISYVVLQPIYPLRATSLAEEGALHAKRTEEANDNNNKVKDDRSLQQTVV